MRCIYTKLFIVILFKMVVDMVLFYHELKTFIYYSIYIIVYTIGIKETKS